MHSLDVDCTNMHDMHSLDVDRTYGACLGGHVSAVCAGKVLLKSDCKYQIRVARNGVDNPFCEKTCQKYRLPN